ncbi:uncharacterized protein LOC110429612 [Sorghum bicolor]|uniref:Uncharacterized protein n=1 Tax=Sorghum bicolor TaxID=4558 RepID=C5YTB0_SORBI|nr:uncharacterized protein LOC110429612 [Sorghum bicolor]EES16795.2 hypothetical protein SORBI_3008G065400 [Sorghum bicolor]|eukprot:XP_021301479.1 uncharacterized protein LOC110429612 [Sorghum bicolor]
MAAAGAALLRSVATKMARAPPRRLPSALERHGRLSTGSRFSTSTGSTPQPANQGPQTHNQEVPSSLGYRAIVAFNEAASIVTLFLWGGIAFMHFSVSPALDRIEADLDAQRQSWASLREETKKSHERTRAILVSNKESQIEATDVFEGKRITGIGTK